jgi:PhoH-like ATPase
MTKNYVLDTNVLIHDPQSIFQFQDNNLYVPVYVLEELDKIKSEQSLRGRNSREACRIIDDLRSQGSLSEGVKIGDSLFTIYVPKERKVINVSLDPNSMDSRILQSMIEIRDNHPDNRTILVTMDVNLRVRAESIGLQTAPYESQSVDTNNFNNDPITVEVDYNDLANFFKNGVIELNEDYDLNASLILKSGTSSALARVKSESGILVAKKLNIPPHVLGLKPKNVEQSFAIDLLLDDSVKLVTLMGSAGSGKSILALSTALYNIFELKLYQKLLISRPVIPMGRDIGFLPGSADEKLRPYMQPIYDNIEYLLMSSSSRRRYSIESCDKLFEDNILEIEPLVYIRGRSIINQIMIVDEGQSLTQHEVKTIVSRCGENTKIIFTGDIEQIDNPYITKDSSGLSVLVSKIQNNSLVGHLKLQKGERSELANLAVANL